MGGKINLAFQWESDKVTLQKDMWECNQADTETGGPESDRQTDTQQEEQLFEATSAPDSLSPEQLRSFQADFCLAQTYVSVPCEHKPLDHNRSRPPTGGAGMSLR